jgi:2,3-bisphosphoglycerate-dependent phosphoglycerate mutase
MSGSLWLIRHGATEWSDAGRLNGWTDLPLNERGRQQARSLADPLRTIRFDGAWSSDLVRSTETARLSFGEPVVDPRLRELDFGDLEGRRWEEIANELQRALLDFDGFEAPGGEPVAAFRERVMRFVDGLTPGNHAVFTHGGVIRLLLRATGSHRRIPPGDFVVVARQRVLAGEGKALHPCM